MKFFSLNNKDISLSLLKIKFYVLLAAGSNLIMVKQLFMNYKLLMSYKHKQPSERYFSLPLILYFSMFKTNQLNIF